MIYKVGVQEREDRRSSLRYLPSRSCESAKRPADCMERVFDPMKGE